MLAKRWPEEPGFCPGTMMTGPHPLHPEPEGGPQEGVSGEMGKNPGELESEPEPEGGPQEGVSGEMGANPGELESEPEPEGGPQEGVSGEMGANPGELSAEAESEEPDTWAAWTISGAERERVSPSLSIYMVFPFCFIA